MDFLDISMFTIHHGARAAQRTPGFPGVKQRVDILQYTSTRGPKYHASIKWWVCILSYAGSKGVSHQVTLTPTA